MTAAPSRRRRHQRSPAATAEEAIERHLDTNLRAPDTRRFSRTLLGVFELGGAMGVLHWATARSVAGVIHIDPTQNTGGSIPTTLPVAFFT